MQLTGLEFERSDALPVVVRAKGRGADLIAWAQAHRGAIDEALLDKGALLFRGFRINGVVHFERFITDIFATDPIGYRNRSTPRSTVRGNIYTSTEYPADQHIPLHNENAYTSSWARKILFHCVKPSDSGGETPIADSRRVYARIPEATRARFEAHGVLYVRNYDALDLPWQQVFQTEDPAEVEAQCAELGIEFEWLGEGRLRTREVAQASIDHPQTGERVWFNQAHLFHVSSLEARTREALLASVGEAFLPRHAYFGDGSPIGAEDLAAVRAAYDAETVAFPWQAGDILLLDNMLAAHGRRPFEGSRKVVVGMVEPYAPGAAPLRKAAAPAPMLGSFM
jgi:alpha-ketoglutarate-dependent taurine dioxygenase